MKRHRVDDTFASVSHKVTQATGSFWAFIAAAAVIVVWLISGPIFRWSDTWQLVINTSTTIVTFLMVFVIQHAQNKENRAVQLKLDELIAASEGASNRLIDVEDLSQDELDRMYARFCYLAESAKGRERGAKLSVDDGDQDVEEDGAEPPRYNRRA